MTKKLIRETYLSKIRPFYDDREMIKVLEGMRRAGKSTILEQIIDELSERGVREEDIIYINLERRGYKNIKNAEALEKLLGERCESKKGFYLFVDEIQRAKGFEEVIEAYRAEGECSIFITGSNSYLMSGELSTYLTGRYISFEIYPFSFREAHLYGGLTGEDDFEKLQDYMTYGGLPRRYSYAKQEVGIYVESIIGEIIKKDLSKRVRNEELFEAVLTYICLNPGITISYSSIQKYLRGEGVKTTRKTIGKYVNLLEKAKLIYLLKPDFLKGKQSLKAHSKSYLSDLGIRKALAPAMELDYSSMLENIVFLELSSRGYRVRVGNLQKGEIDFVAEKGGKLAYFQVTYSLMETKTREREYASLLSLDNAYPKYVISLDPLNYDYRGIRHLRLIKDFLLSEEWEIR